MGLIGWSSFDFVVGPRDPAALLATSHDGTAAAGAPVVRPSAVAYLLIYNPPEGPDVPSSPEVPLAGGWTLLARRDTGWGWSRSLAAHGASAHAPARVAKAVAVRVLASFGVTVEGWTNDQPAAQHAAQPADPAVFRARLATAQYAGPPMAAPRRAVFGQLQGH
jgi:hypothetical protein